MNRWWKIIPSGRWSPLREDVLGFTFSTSLSRLRSGGGLCDTYDLQIHLCDTRDAQIYLSDVDDAEPTFQKRRGPVKISAPTFHQAIHQFTKDQHPDQRYASFDYCYKNGVLLADIGKRLKAFWKNVSFHMDNTGYLITTKEIWILPILLSKPLDFFCRATFRPLKDPWKGGRIRFIHSSMKFIPVR